MENQTSLPGQSQITQAIQWTNQTQSKHRSNHDWVWFLIGPIVVMQNQNKCELLSTLKWKLLLNEDKWSNKSILCPISDN